MKIFPNKRPKDFGLPPGTLVYVGEKRTGDITMDLFDFDDKGYSEVRVKEISDCLPFKESPQITWLNINGLHEVEKLREIGEMFGIHPLTMEDILNTGQRPKVEFFDDYIFIVLKMLQQDKKDLDIISEQVSIIIGTNFVISFQETDGDVFDPIRERIRSGKGKIRRNGSDYLAYAMIDAVVDNYFVILETFGDLIDYYDEIVYQNPTHETIKDIHSIRRELLEFRKSIWPLREVINGLLREEVSLISDSTRVYLRDVYDHTIQVMDNIETDRDMAAGLRDMYMSSISNRMNEIMKVLTIISTIFIPLTFIVGVYGMNFNTDASPLNMPELDWYFGYPLIVLIMLLISLGMVAYFKIKKWF